MPWAHIPELVAPSYYTSLACLAYVIAEGWCKDEIYRCPVCGGTVHANIRAAMSIGLPLLARLLRLM